MRRVTLLFIMFAYFSSVTEVHELFKVSNLIAHYLQHRESDHNLSFSDFLFLHYDEHSEHADSSEHNDDLPFKSHHVPIAWFNFVAPIFTASVKQEVILFYLASKPVAYYRCITATDRESSIWQPPKMVS